MVPGKWRDCASLELQQSLTRQHMGRIQPYIFSSLTLHKDLTICYCFFIICFNCHWFVCSESTLSWPKCFLCVCGWPSALLSSNRFIQGPGWKLYLGKDFPNFPGRVLLALEGLHKAGPFCTCVWLSCCYPLPGFHSPRSPLLIKMN